MVPESQLPYLNKPMHLSLTESTFVVICWVSDTVLGMGDTQMNILGVSASRSNRLVGKRDIKLSTYEPIYVECYKRGKNQIVWNHKVVWDHAPHSIRHYYLSKDGYIREDRRSAFAHYIHFTTTLPVLHTHLQVTCRSAGVPWRSR